MKLAHCCTLLGGNNTETHTNKSGVINIPDISGRCSFGKAAAAVTNSPLAPNKPGLSLDGFDFPDLIYSNSENINAGRLAHQSFGIVYVMGKQRGEPRT